MHTDGTRIGRGTGLPAAFWEGLDRDLHETAVSEQGGPFSGDARFAHLLQNGPP